MRLDDVACVVDGSHPEVEGAGMARVEWRSVRKITAAEEDAAAAWIAAGVVDRQIRAELIRGSFARSPKVDLGRRDVEHLVRDGLRGCSTLAVKSADRERVCAPSRQIQGPAERNVSFAADDVRRIRDAGIEGDRRRAGEIEAAVAW